MRPVQGAVPNGLVDRTHGVPIGVAIAYDYDLRSRPAPHRRQLGVNVAAWGDGRYSAMHATTRLDNLVEADSGS